MDTERKHTKGLWGTVVLFFLILTCAALIVGGGILYAIGTETTGAIICIVLGALGLLFFGASVYISKHPENSSVQKLVVSSLIVVGGGIVFAILFSMLQTILFSPIADMEHYRQVYQTPVTVTATVTKHDSYDNDGDTDYRSYVTYIVDNTRYKDYPYENRDRKVELTPVDTEVVLQVSPKDPSRQISNLKNNGSIFGLTAVYLFLGLAGLCKLLQKRSLTKSNRSQPDRETIQQDIKTMVRGRFMRPFLLFCWLGYAFLHWQYSMLFGQLSLIVAAVCFVLWLFCMYTAIRDYRHADSDDFTVHRDVLVEKKELSDSDGTTYVLYYNNSEKTWKTTTKESTFHRTKEGDMVLAVYLPGKSKPILHYNLDGDAC